MQLEDVFGILAVTGDLHVVGVSGSILEEIDGRLLLATGALF